MHSEDRNNVRSSLDTLNASLAQDTRSYTFMISRLLSQINPSQLDQARFAGIDPHDLAQPSSNSIKSTVTSSNKNNKLPVSAPIRGGRRCEFIARAKSHVRRASVKRKQEKARTLGQKLIADFESGGTVPRWMHEMKENEMSYGRHLKQLKALQKRRLVAEVKRRETRQKKQREMREQRALAKNNEDDEVGDRDNMVTLTRDIANMRVLNTLYPAFQFDRPLAEPSQQTMRRSKIAPTRAHRDGTLRITAEVDEAKTVSSHDWEGSLLNAYDSPDTSRSESRREVKAPMLADIVTQHSFDAEDDGMRQVSSEGLSALSEPGVGRPPDRISFDTTAASMSPFSSPRSSRRYPPTRANTTSGSHTSYSPDCSSHRGNSREVPNFSRPQLSTVKRQNIINTERWEDRKLENFAKRVGWKQALPRALEDGKAKVNKLRRRSQPWRAQPPIERPRESREIVATVAVKYWSSPESDNSDRDSELQS